MLKDPRTTGRSFRFRSVGGRSGRLERLAVDGETEVQELVGDHEILETGTAVGEVSGQGDGSSVEQEPRVTRLMRTIRGSTFTRRSQL